MKDGKLWELFLKLNKKQERRLKKALQSPVYNREVPIQRLFEWLERQKKRKKPDLHPKSAYTFIHTKKPFDAADFYALKSRLLHIIERFLTAEALEANPLKAKTELIKTYRNKKLPKHFKQNMREARTLLDKQTQRNSQFHFFQYQLEVEQFEMEGRETRTRQTNLQALTNELNAFFIAEKLRWATIMQSHQAVYKSEYKQPFLATVLQVVETGDWLTVPSIAVYYYSYKALTHPDEEENFSQLKKLIQEQGQLFPENELREVYTIAINFGVKKLNTGKIDKRGI